MPRQKKQHLKRRKDGRFRLIYEGQTFYSKPWGDEEECFAQKEEYIRQKAIGVYLTGGKTPLGMYAAKWLPIHKAGVKASTFNQYSSILEAILEPIANLPIKDITPDHITAIFAAQKDRSSSYIKKAKFLVREIFDSAIAQKMIRDNPARSKTISIPKGTEGTHRAITQQERDIIHGLQHSFRPMVMTMLYAGVRPEEARYINVDRDVDFEHKIIHVRGAVAYAGTKSTISAGKNEFAEREILLLPILENELKQLHGYIGTCKHNKDIMTASSYERAWESYKLHFERMLNNFPPGKRWWGHTKEHKKMAETAMRLRKEGKEEEATKYDLPSWENTTIRPYDLRHSFCTMARDAGIDIKICMQWMGHSDEKMILRIYDHVTDYREKISAETLKKIGFQGQNQGQTKKFHVKRSKINRFQDKQG